jgi:predicted esterase
MSRTAPPRDALLSGGIASVVAEPVGAAVAAPPPAPLVEPGSEIVVGDYFVHMPPVFTERMEVLVALHGMGGRGSEFCQALLSRTDRERWIVVAPTFAYGDWRDPNQVMREESSRFIPKLHEFLEELPARTGLSIEPKAAFLGFSRGAQLAQRFAMVYPEQTLGVAALSAGTYTLPLSQTEVDGHAVTLRYPFGTADIGERFGRQFDPTALRGIPFWIGVGAEDRNPADLPRQWDPYLGTNRVARAEAFAQRLREGGTPVQLALVPGVGHSITEEMDTRALDFIAGLQ